MRAADLDGDQKGDAISFGGRDSEIGVMLGQGDGPFTPRIQIPISAGLLELGDTSGDGKADRVAVVRGGRAANCGSPSTGATPPSTH